jgi:hypothetical protein
MLGESPDGRVLEEVHDRQTETERGLQAILKARDQ